MYYSSHNKDFIIIITLLKIQKNKFDLDNLIKSKKIERKNRNLSRKQEKYI